MPEPCKKHKNSEIWNSPSLSGGQVLNPSRIAVGRCRVAIWGGNWEAIAIAASVEVAALVAERMGNDLLAEWYAERVLDRAIKSSYIYIYVYIYTPVFIVCYKK